MGKDKGVPWERESMAGAGAPDMVSAGDAGG